jgi:hypothetical protein
MKKMLIIMLLSFVLVWCSTKKMFTYEYTCNDSMLKQWSFQSTNSIDAYTFVWNEIRETKKNCKLLWMKEDWIKVFQTELY